MGSLAWLSNAEAVIAATSVPVKYMCAIEVDSRGLEPFKALLDRLRAVNGDYWTWSLDDGTDVITTPTRLRRICLGHNLVGTFAIEAGASHVFFLASDTQCRPDALEKLLELNVAACACHIPTYCQDGPKAPQWPEWDVRIHMESCAAMLLRRDVVRQLKWRYDPDAGTTDDPSMHRDLKLFLGEDVFSRHDVLATHFPESVPRIEDRHSDEDRRIHHDR